MKFLPYLILLIIHLLSISPVSSQVLSQDIGLSQAVLGVWRVKVAGEDRARELIVYRSHQPSDTDVKLDAVYGWVDSKPAVVNAKISINGQREQLTIISPAASIISVFPNVSGKMDGKFETKSGEIKNVEMLKVLDYSNPNTLFGDEEKDFHILPTKELSAKFHHPTPLSVPGAKTIRTLELKKVLESNEKPIVMDVLDGGDSGKKPVIPSSIWVGSNAGNVAIDNQRFADLLAKLTSFDKSVALVFYCAGIECWSSYNASLRAVELGYSNVYWYRGGAQAWSAAKLPTRVTDKYLW